MYNTFFGEPTLRSNVSYTKSKSDYNHEQAHRLYRSLVTTVTTYCETWRSLSLHSAPSTTCFGTWHCTYAWHEEPRQCLIISHPFLAVLVANVFSMLDPIPWCLPQQQHWTMRYFDRFCQILTLSSVADLMQETGPVVVALQCNAAMLGAGLSLAQRDGSGAQRRTVRGRHRH